MYKPCSPAPRPFSQLVPEQEPSKCARMRSPRKLPRHYRTFSLDRGQKIQQLDNQPDVASIDSGDTLIPDTEPEVIGTLWEHIREGLERSMSPKESKIPTINPVYRGKRAPESEQDNKLKSRGGAPSATSSLPYSTQIGDPSTDITTASSTKVREASPYDRDFCERILKPRGITIVEKRDISVWDHFQTKEPDQDRISFYRDKGSKHSAVWLNADSDFLQEVANEYHCMVEGNMCEAEFASYAKETLFLRDPRVSYREFSDLRAWKTDRMLELVAKPNEDSFGCWESPPVLESDHSLKMYDFDIRPDCAYWLSLQAFNADYVSKVRQWAFVMKRRITCPYLFIEFKKDEKEPSSAKNQVAAAASLSLYNRFNLRILRIEQGGRPPDQISVQNIRVYGITFQGASFVVWCVQPKLRETAGEEWAGCTMTSIHHGICDNQYDVRELTDWINEIHRWGLSVHGPTCENDIKICVSQRFATRVSDVNESLQ